MGLRDRGTFRDSQAIRQDRFQQDLRDLGSACAHLEQQLANTQRSLSNAPITSHGWTYSLLLGQMGAMLVMLRVCIEAGLTLEEHEDDPWSAL